MSSVNKCIFVGRVGKQPEVRFTQGGQAVANFIQDGSHD
jgi:single-stranded DNA-binding protein